MHQEDEDNEIGCKCGCMCCCNTGGIRCTCTIEDRIHNLGTHLSHCNFGEYKGMCKYGDEEDCPALSEEWGWFGKNLQENERLRVKNHFITTASWRMIDAAQGEGEMDLSNAMNQLEDVLRNHKNLVIDE